MHYKQGLQQHGYIDCTCTRPPKEVLKPQKSQSLTKNIDDQHANTFWTNPEKTLLPPLIHYPNYVTTHNIYSLVLGK